MSRRLPTGVLVAVSLVFWTSAPPARAATPPALTWTNYLGSEKDDSFGDLIRDPGTGDVIITGTLPGTTAGGILTARFSADGTWKGWRVLSGDVLDGSRAIALGANGLFIAGYSRSSQFENNSSLLLSPATRGEQDGLVALLNPDLTVRWVYLIDFDLGAEVINDLVVMNDGSVVVVGVTAPKVSDIESATSATDVFVVRLTPPTGGTGKQMVTENWRHRLQGGNADIASAVALDSGGTIYLAGKSKSANLREGTSWGLAYTEGGTFDGFVMKREQSDGTLVAATYFGGQGQDSVNGLVLHDNTVFVAGTSSSAQLPKATNTPGMFSRAFAASFEQGTMGHLNTVTLGKGLTGNDEGRALALVGDQLYMGGIVGTQDFPGMEFPTPFRPYKGFVAKVDLSEDGPSPSTPSIVGGNRDDAVLALGGASVDGGTVLFVGGNTTSTNLSPPGTNPSTSPYSSRPSGFQDMFFGRLNTTSTAPTGPDDGTPGGGNPGNPGGPTNGGGSINDDPDGSDGGLVPRSPLGFSCGANASGGGPGVMAFGSLVGLALLAAARRGRRG